METHQSSDVVTNMPLGGSPISGQLNQCEVRLSISGLEQPTRERRRMGDAPRPFLRKSMAETSNGGNDITLIVTPTSAPVCTVVRTSLPRIVNSADQPPAVRTKATGSGAPLDGRSRRGLRAAQSLDAGLSNLNNGTKRGRLVTRVAKAAGGRSNAIETSLIRKVTLLSFEHRE